MDGRAVAPAAGTVLNALATGTGSAFAIDLETTASVELTNDGEIVGTIAGQPQADTTLVERCAAMTIVEYAERAGLDETDVGAHIDTESEVPMASGLKSSSAAANATVLATLDALEVVDSVERIDACRLGVQAAREAGVTATGAFDDASASMLGGLTMTDNEADELLFREEVEWDAVVWTPPRQSFSADADVTRCEHVAPLAEHVADLAARGQYGTAMTVNGLAFCAALDFPAAPIVDALPHADGASLSGTGPSYVAVGERAALKEVKSVWNENPGTVRLTTTRPDGARTT